MRGKTNLKGVFNVVKGENNCIGGFDKLSHRLWVKKIIGGCEKFSPRLTIVVKGSYFWFVRV